MATHYLYKILYHNIINNSLGCPGWVIIIFGRIHNEADNTTHFQISILDSFKHIILFNLLQFMFFPSNKDEPDNYKLFHIRYEKIY